MVLAGHLATYILGGLLVRILGEGEGLGEASRALLQVFDDEDQADRERHPRRHVEQPATINMMGWRFSSCRQLYPL